MTETVHRTSGNWLDSILNCASDGATLPRKLFCDSFPVPRVYVDMLFNQVSETSSSWKWSSEPMWNQASPYLSLVNWRDDLKRWRPTESPNNYWSRAIATTNYGHYCVWMETLTEDFITCGTTQAYQFDGTSIQCVNSVSGSSQGKSVPSDSDFSKKLIILTKE